MGLLRVHRGVLWPPALLHMRRGHHKEGAQDAHNTGTAVWRLCPLCSQARLWRSLPSRPAPVRPARLCLCALSFPRRGELSLPRDRAVSPAGGGIYGVQDVCREPWPTAGIAHEFPGWDPAKFPVPNVRWGASSRQESVAPVATCLDLLVALGSCSAAMRHAACTQGRLRHTPL